MPMHNIRGEDNLPGFEGYAHDHCSECGGIACGFVHAGEYPCNCGEEM